MPTPEAVRNELATIVATVLDADPSAVQPGTTFKKLGADSLTTIEIGEELARRFNVYLPDETINGFTTVGDAINAIVTHDGSAPKGRVLAPVPATFDTSSSAVDEPDTPEPTSSNLHDLTGPVAPTVAQSRAKSAAKWLAGIGAIVGIAVGLVFSLFLAASGIESVSLPPLPGGPSKSTPAPDPTPTPSKSPSASPSPTESGKPSLTVSPTQIQPGVNFSISGRFPKLGADTPLTIETRQAGGEWEVFPYIFNTRADGQFQTKIRTQTIGEREIRIRHAESNTQTNVVKISIG